MYEYWRYFTDCQAKYIKMMIKNLGLLICLKLFCFASAKAEKEPELPKDFVQKATQQGKLNSTV